jgi:tRNA G18 (ribose-2'-O)-methylase SpoU
MSNAVAVQLSNPEVSHMEADPDVNAMELSTSSEIFRPENSRRGYFGIGIENSKTPLNLGTLWRSANLYEAAFLFTVGKRYAKQCSDTMATERHVPLFHYSDFSNFYENLPYGCQLVGVELCDESIALPAFAHPERVVYLLGAEDHGLSKTALARCHHVIQIPCVKPFSMNVAVAGSVVMYDRFVKRGSITAALDAETPR